MSYMKLHDLTSNASLPTRAKMSAKPTLNSDCFHCWSAGDATQVVVNTVFGPIDCSITYVRRCIICGKEEG